MAQNHLTDVRCISQIYFFTEIQGKTLLFLKLGFTWPANLSFCGFSCAKKNIYTLCVKSKTLYLFSVQKWPNLTTPYPRSGLAYFCLDKSYSFKNTYRYPPIFISSKVAQPNLTLPRIRLGILQYR